MDRKLPERERLRLKNFDYSTTGAYFVTICTKDRKRILSKIVGDDVLGVPTDVELLPHGQIADKYIKQFNDFYSNISIEQYVIMPNHIHILLLLSENGSPRTSTPTARQTSTVSHFVSTLKRFCNKEYGYDIWQRGFYDHVVRNRNDFDEIIKYIYENPIRWIYDQLYNDE